MGASSATAHPGDAVAAPPRAGPVERARVLLADPRRQTLAAAALYLAFALAIMWPWPLHPGSTILGPEGSDLTGDITKYRELAEDLQPPFLPGEVSDLDAPYGLEVNWTRDLASLTSSATIWALSILFGAVAAYGIFTIAAFAGSGLAMFLLARWITGSALAALVAGVAFGFSTYIYSHATLSIGQGWILVLLLWRMLVVAESPTLRNGLLAGLAAVFTISWAQYWLLIGGVLYVTLALTGVGIGWLRGRLGPAMRAQAAAAALVAAYLLALALISWLTEFEGVPERAVGESLAYSARALMFVVPTPLHPLVGDQAFDFLNDRYAYGSQLEGKTAFASPIYLGLVPMALAALGAAVAGRGLWRGRAAALAERPQAAIVCAAAAVLTALLFAAPPEVTVAGTTVSFPGHYVNEVTSVFRVTSRFGLVVLLGVCLIAAVGLAWLLPRLRPAAALALVALLAVVAGVDGWGRTPGGTSRVDEIGLYDALDGKDGILAEYPLGPAATQSDNFPNWHQDQHGLALFNGFDQRTESEARKLDLVALGDRRVPPELRRLGVSWVVVRDVDGLPPSVPRPGEESPGLELAARDRYGALYRVTAAPATEAVHSLSGFGPPEGEGPSFIRWMGLEPAELELVAACDPCRGTLRFRSASFAEPRELTVRSPDGRVLTRAQVAPGPDETTVTVPVEFGRRTVLTLTTNPPARSPAQLGAGDDTRNLGVFVRHPARLELER